MKDFENISTIDGKWNENKSNQPRDVKKKWEEVNERGVEYEEPVL